MVIIQFIPQVEVIKADKKTKPHLETLGVLQEMYFIMPVRININGIELLETPRNHLDSFCEIWQVDDSGVASPGQVGEIETQNSMWLHLPILDVAMVGLEQVFEAWQNVNSVYILPEYDWRLIFKRVGNEIEVYSEVNGKTVSENYDELVKSFKEFGLKVKKYLFEEIPELNNHHYLKDWLENV